MIIKIVGAEILVTEILNKIGGTGVVPSEADPANKAAMLRQALGRRFRIRDHETLEPTPILLNQFKKEKNPLVLVTGCEVFSVCDSAAS